MKFSPQAKKKIRAILAWYRYEAPSLTMEQRLFLLKDWFTACIEHEEYEMAMALRKARCNLVKILRKRNIGERSFGTLFSLIVRIEFRWFKRTSFGKRFFPKPQ